MSFTPISRGAATIFDVLDAAQAPNNRARPPRLDRHGEDD